MKTRFFSTDIFFLNPAATDTSTAITIALEEYILINAYFFIENTLVPQIVIAER